MEFTIQGRPTYAEMFVMTKLHDTYVVGSDWLEREEVLIDVARKKLYIGNQGGSQQQVARSSSLERDQEEIPRNWETSPPIRRQENEGAPNKDVSGNLTAEKRMLRSPVGPYMQKTDEKPPKKHTQDEAIRESLQVMGEKIIQVGEDYRQYLPLSCHSSILPRSKQHVLAETVSGEAKVTRPSLLLLQVIVTVYEEKTSVPEQGQPHSLCDEENFSQEAEYAKQPIVYKVENRRKPR